MERKVEVNAQVIAKDLGKYNPFFEKEIEARIVNGHTEAGMDAVYTAFIKEAAKCSYYASDLFYSLKEIDKRLETFDLDNEECFKPILVGIRKSGVDGTDYVTIRSMEASMSCAYAICYPADYLSVFAITFERDREWGDLGYFKIKVVGKYV